MCIVALRSPVETTMEALTSRPATAALKPGRGNCHRMGGRRCLVAPAVARAVQSMHFAKPMADPEVVKDRAKAAVLGALLADAATMPLHWHYDIGQIKRKVTGQPDGPLQAALGLLLPDNMPLDLASLQAEFHSPSENMFYKYPVGQLSPYGAEAACLVRSLAAEGSLVPERYAEQSVQEYRAYSGRLNSLSKRFLEQWDAGARWPTCGVAGDTQAHSLVRVPAIVARYAGSEQCRDAVADAVRVHQAQQGPVDYAQALATLLERCILGAPVADALKWGAFNKDPANVLYDEQRKEIADALSDMDVDPRAIVKKYGISCALPGPFIGPLAMIFGARGDFVTAVRANIMAGGDNCSRAAVVGALCGANGGMACLPESWRSKMADWKALEAAADKIVSDAKFV